MALRSDSIDFSSASLRKIQRRNGAFLLGLVLLGYRLHMPPVEAIYHACLMRFRPILMTTMAALFGGIPLAVGMGVGSELRQPLGITIVGGLIVSQMLTLFTTPVVYLFFDRVQGWLMNSPRVRSELKEPETAS